MCQWCRLLICSGVSHKRLMRPALSVKFRVVAWYLNELCLKRPKCFSFAVGTDNARRYPFCQRIVFKTVGSQPTLLINSINLLQNEHLQMHVNLLNPAYFLHVFPEECIKHVNVNLVQWNVINWKHDFSVSVLTSATLKTGVKGRCRCGEQSPHLVISFDWPVWGLIL